ncbi:DNA-binding protein WhiA [Euzebya tangerina]|uniref:DNA-binding protein WhiA n=1 Tax=Euzebya tangerina TaxID=591198 RepID=UPI000E32153C|nr:DNA-binding protein WhiA [Euzebya tangerina]
MSLTTALREELAHLPGRDDDGRQAELAAMVRFGGSLTLRGGADGTRVTVVVRCGHGAVARRLRESVLDLLGDRPTVIQSAGTLDRTSAYLVELAGPGLTTLGLLDADGRPQRGIRPPHTGRPLDYLAGAVMVAGRLSGTGQPVHFEIAAPSEPTAADLAAMLSRRATGARVVIKSGEAVGDLLIGMGAHGTFLEFDQSRMRRELRGRVNRSVNAERANLRRSTAAAAGQIDRINGIVAAIGWDGMPAELRDVALVRIANPAASLADLGQLLDPPVGKATVHRRLARIDQLAQETAEQIDPDTG